MQTTRKRIMDYLETSRMATALEMSSAFRMTGANLRHHLKALMKAREIEVVGSEPTIGRGRPTLLYMKTSQAQEHSLGELASALFQQLLGKRNSSKRERGMRQLARNMGDKNHELGGTITKRLVAAVEHLNGLHYRAHWEAHSDGPRVILGQCPYATIIDKHPELCQMDKYLLEGLVDERVAQTSKLVRTPEGPVACVFVVESKDKSIAT